MRNIDYEQIIHLRNEMRECLQYCIDNNYSILPSTPKISVYDALDDQTMSKLNRFMTVEQRMSFIQSVLNFENIDDNLLFLISNSGQPTQAYVLRIIIFCSVNMNVVNCILFPIANIFLYALANIRMEDEHDYERLYDSIFIHLMKAATMGQPTLMNEIFEVYDPEKIGPFIDASNNYAIRTDLSCNANIPNNPNYVLEPIIEVNPQALHPLTIQDIIEKNIESQDPLDDIGLATDRQLDEKVNEFYKKVEADKAAQIEKVRNKLLLAGAGFGLSFLLNFLGVPPIGGLLLKLIKKVKESC